MSRSPSHFRGAQADVLVEICTCFIEICRGFKEICTGTFDFRCLWGEWRLWRAHPQFRFQCVRCAADESCYRRVFADGVSVAAGGSADGVGEHGHDLVPITHNAEIGARERRGFGI